MYAHIVNCILSVSNLGDINKIPDLLLCYKERVGSFYGVLLKFNDRRVVAIE